MYSLSLNIFDFVIIENVLIFFFLFKALITAEESNPPDKKLETGTSLSNRFSTLFSNMSINSSSINSLSSRKLGKSSNYICLFQKLLFIKEIFINSRSYTEKTLLKKELRRYRCSKINKIFDLIFIKFVII